jgi:RND family efflux transporter MFP subunit
MKKYLIYAIIIAGIAGVFYKKVYIPKHTFQVVSAKKGDIKVIVNGVGNVGAENIYKVSALYGGKITNFNFQVGDFVKKGQLIANIDSVDLKDKIEELKANLKVINDNINSTIADKNSAYKQYLYQEEVLRKNTKLYKKRAISELEYKKYKTDRDIAKYKVVSLEEKLKSLKNQIPQIQASIKGLEEKLKRYTLIAPIDGYITKKYVSNYDIVGNNQPLIDIVNQKDVWIDTFIDTRISSDVKIGDKATIKLRSSKNTVDGYVYKINPVNNPVTNEREIFIKFNQVKIPFYLEEQAIVNIKVNNLKDVTKIPAKALSYNNGYGVWVLDGNKVHFKKIKVLVNNSKVIATRDNVSKVVIPNPKKLPLKEGMKIYHD